jgi:hypothetical protein
MNYDKLQDTVVKNICKVIKSGAGNTSFIQTLYDEFTKNFEDIAKVFGVEFEDRYSTSELEKSIKEFKDKIGSRATTQRPKQRYLCYSGSDDYGNSYCDCVTVKSIEYVKGALGNTEHDNCEYLYMEDSKLLKAISDSQNIPVDDLLGMDVDALLDTIDEFFEELSKNEDVSLERFSECLECPINNSRHSGSSSSWIAL